MTLRSKQRLTLLVLVVFASWPLVHRGMVARYHTTPWKLMGFAMYCVPRVTPLVEIYAHYGDRRAPVDTRGSHMRDVRREIARFATFRDVWGDLLSAELIGDVTTRILTRADEIEVVVTEGYLDETWRLAARETIYRYGPQPGARAREGERTSRRRRGLDRKALD